MENSDTREPKPKTPQRPRSNSKKESGTPTEEKKRKIKIEDCELHLTNESSVPISRYTLSCNTPLPLLIEQEERKIKKKELDYQNQLAEQRTSIIQKIQSDPKILNQSINNNDSLSLSSSIKKSMEIPSENKLSPKQIDSSGYLQNVTLPEAISSNSKAKDNSSYLDTNPYKGKQSNNAKSNNNNDNSLANSGNGFITNNNNYASQKLNKCSKKKNKSHRKSTSKSQNAYIFENNNYLIGKNPLNVSTEFIDESGYKTNSTGSSLTNSPIFSSSKSSSISSSTSSLNNPFNDTGMPSPINSHEKLRMETELIPVGLNMEMESDIKESKKEEEEPVGYLVQSDANSLSNKGYDLSKKKEIESSQNYLEGQNSKRPPTDLILKGMDKEASGYNPNEQPNPYIVDMSSFSSEKKDMNAKLNTILNNLNEDQLRNLVHQITKKDPVITDFVNDILKYNPKAFAKGEARDNDKVLLWNSSFQEAASAVRKLKPNSSQNELLRAYEKVSNISRDFIYTATTYGKIIISEVYLPPEDKTIKPIRGGIAGGEKYLCKGIYFKFAVNSSELFDDDQAAQKVAGHELKSLNRAFGLGIKDLHFPMMILLDYRGFRLSAMSTLPINEYTLVYGSSDAGKTVSVSSQIQPRMEELGKSLNLREHLVNANGILEKIFTPIDLEGHFGYDKRFYLIDFSRLFPPTLPDLSKTSYVYKLFRSEFVQTYKKPLCSDAHSRFTLNDPFDNEYKQDIKEATEYLKCEVIPKFASQLTTVKPNFRKDYPLIQALHAIGINIRFIGLVRSHLDEREEYWRFIILFEMICRVIKQMIRIKLRQKMRELKLSGEEHYRRIIVNEFNLIFGKYYGKSEIFWQEILKKELCEKFEKALSPQEMDPNFNLKEALSKSVEGLSDGRCLLFQRMTQELGLVLSSTTMTALTENPQLYDYNFPLDETDLTALEVRVKQMNLAQHSEGVVIKLKAYKRIADEAKRLYQLAIRKFMGALNLSPNNKFTLRNLAECLSNIGEEQQSEYYFQRALEIDPSDPITLFRFACSLEQFQNYDEAEANYLSSLEINPQQAQVLTVYADFLWYIRKNNDDAEAFYKASLLVDPLNSFTLNNYACFLFSIRKDIPKAEELFTRLLGFDKEKDKFNPNRSKSELWANDKNNYTHIQNYSSFFKYTGKKDSDESTRALLKISSELESNKNDFSINYSTEVPKKTSKTTKRNLRKKKNRKARQEKQRKEMLLEGSEEGENDFFHK